MEEIKINAERQNMNYSTDKSFSQISTFIYYIFSRTSIKFAEI